MLNARVVITLVAGAVALAAYLGSKGSYPQGSGWPLGISMGAFIGVYVVGNVAWGVVMGMREASAARRRPPAAGPAAPGDEERGTGR